MVQTLCMLDLDGVLADFHSAAVKAMGMTQEEYGVKIPPGVWDMNMGIMDEDEFWNRIKQVPNFWENLDVIPDADEIVKVCEYYFGDEILLVSSPSNEVDAFSGKAKWVKKHFPKYYNRLFVGQKKYKLAHSGVVLVDDYEKNCVKFQEKGGKTVLVPSRSNQLYAEVYRRVEVVQEGLESLIRKDVKALVGFVS